MRKLRDLLRLKYETGLGHRAIARACSIGVSTVSVHLQRAMAAGLRWPLPTDLDDAALEARLFANPSVVPTGPRPQPDWRAVHLELKRPSVTLRLLWLEHRDAHPTGYGYSQFCDRYGRCARTLKPSMRQVLLAGERLFVDFAGQKPALVDRTTGEVVVVELFVGVLGASGLIYAEATRKQELPAWVDAYRRMLDALEGSTAIWIPDNLKSGITTPNRYEPAVNRSYSELAQQLRRRGHSGAQPGAQDKAKVEVSVQNACLRTSSRIAAAPAVSAWLFESGDYTRQDVLNLCEEIGATGFEPATFRSRNVAFCGSQAVLHSRYGRANITPYVTKSPLTRIQLVGRRRFPNEFGSSGWTRTSNPPVNRIMQVVYLVDSSCL
jgi:transposase